MFCSCQFCKWVRGKGMAEVRTRSQVMICGDLIIDFPPEAYYHSFAMGVDLSSVKTLLITHSHMDHFYAHDFILRGYKYARLSEPVLNIYGNAEVKKVYAECTAREMREEVARNINFTEISPFCSFYADGYKVIAIPAEHTKSEQALLYYVEKDGKGYLHMNDTGNLSDAAVRFLSANNAKADVAAYDCTFGADNGHLSARHMGMSDVLAVHEKLLSAGVISRSTKNVITHFSHNSHPSRRAMDEFARAHGFIAAHDGQVIDI